MECFKIIRSHHNYIQRKKKYVANVNADADIELAAGPLPSPFNTVY